MAKKESGRIKAFKERVNRLLERQGWKIEKQPRSSPVDIITTRAGGDRRGFLIKPHGHITRAEMAALHEYQKTNHISVVYIHESSKCEILFSRMYKHLNRR